MDIRNQHVDIEGVSCTIRPIRTGSDDLFRAVLNRKINEGLAAGGDMWAEVAGTLAVFDFAGVCICAQDVVGLTLPAVTDSAAACAAAFIAFQSLPSDVCDGVINAFRAANAPLNAPHLVPAAHLTEEKKASSPTPAQTSDGESPTSSPDAAVTAKAASDSSNAPSRTSA